jgi:hypothetical protein
MIRCDRQSWTELCVALIQAECALATLVELGAALPDSALAPLMRLSSHLHQVHCIVYAVTEAEMPETSAPQGGLQ